MGTRAEIEARQLESLRELLGRVPKGSFYGRKFAGLSAPGTFEEFSKFPFTTKAELAADQRAHPPFGTVLLQPVERYTRFHQTSGTTARWTRS